MERDDSMDTSGPPNSDAAAGDQGAAASGGSGANSVAMQSEKGMPLLGPENHHDYLTNTSRVFTKTFQFYIINQNWQTFQMPDKRATPLQFNTRVIPYFVFMWDLIMWYLSPTEYIDMIRTGRYSKIVASVFQIDYCSHMQTFTTNQADATTAGNGNLSHIRVFRDFNQRKAFTVLDITNGKPELEEGHSKLRNKLYGTQKFLNTSTGTQDIAAVDGPRQYTHLPAMMTQADQSDLLLEQNITSVNMLKATNEKFDTTQHGYSIPITYKPKQSIMAVGPSANTGFQPEITDDANQGTQFNLVHYDRLMQQNACTARHTSDGYDDEEALVPTDASGTDKFWNGYQNDPPSNQAITTAENYEHTTLENYGYKSSNTPWNIKCTNPLMMGVEPRLFPDGTLVPGVTHFEVKTMIMFEKQLGQSVNANPQTTREWGVIKNANWHFNDTSAFVTSGYLKTDNYGYRGQQLFRKPRTYVPPF